MDLGERRDWITFRAPLKQVRHFDGSARSFLASLPAVRRIATARGGLLLCHGTGEDDMHAVQPDDLGYALETNEELQRALRDRVRTTPSSSPPCSWTPPTAEPW